MGLFKKKQQESLEERDARRLAKRTPEIQAEIDACLQ